jgi:hypothetical protein
LHCERRLSLCSPIARSALKHRVGCTVQSLFEHRRGSYQLRIRTLRRTDWPPTPDHPPPDTAGRWSLPQSPDGDRSLPPPLHTPPRVFNLIKSWPPRGSAILSYRDRCRSRRRAGARRSVLSTRSQSVATYHLPREYSVCRRATLVAPTPPRNRRCIAPVAPGGRTACRSWDTRFGA